jgi:group I intron endonuclease
MEYLIADEHRHAAGVYYIENTVNHKRYIGSAKKLRLRFTKHKFELESNSHPNQHLLNAYQKYGAQNFRFSLLAILEPQSGELEKDFFNRLLTLENEFISQYKANEKSFGYNIRLSAESNRGITHAPEALTRIKGKRLSATTRQKMSATRQGIKHHAASLTTEQAAEIKMLLALEFRNVNIAAYFDVKKSIVNDIKNGGAWQHVEVLPATIAAYVVPGFFSQNQSRLNPSDVKRVKYLLLKGLAPSVIATYLNISPHRVASIKSGKTSTHVELSAADIAHYERIIPISELAAAAQLHKSFRTPRQSSRGSQNKSAKVTEHEVLQIKDLLLKGITARVIAAQFQVSEHCIYKIKSGDNWGHLTGFVLQRPGPAKGTAHPNYKHSDAVVLQIMALTADGKTTKEIADLLCLEKTFINRVKAGKTRATITNASAK